MNKTLPLSQGANVRPTVTDGIPYCSPRCLHRKQDDTCKFYPGLTLDDTRICAPKVAAMAREIEERQDEEIQRRANRRKKTT